jgi:hypothetical protein
VTRAAPGTLHVQPGLCGRCEHARRIVSDKGSIFWRCGRSETDPAFPRYPALPVVRCPGFEGAVATTPVPPGPDRTEPPPTT